MSANSSVIIECPICFKFYSEVDPTTLPCGHSCCLEDGKQLKKCFSCNKGFDAKALTVSYNLRDIAILMRGVKLPASNNSQSTTTAPTNTKAPPPSSVKQQAKPAVATKSVFDALNGDDSEEGEDEPVEPVDEGRKPTAAKTGKNKKRNKKKKNKTQTRKQEESESSSEDEESVPKKTGGKHSKEQEEQKMIDDLEKMFDGTETPDQISVKMLSSQKYSAAGDGNFIPKGGLTPGYEVRRQAMAAMSLRCAVCGKDGVFQCSKCRSVRYCSKECQTGHWKLHKKTCILKDESEPASSNTSSAPSVPGRTKLILAELEIGSVHKGYYVEGRIVSDPFKMSAVHLELKDETGNEITCSVYDYSGKRPDGIIMSDIKVNKDVDAMVYDNTFGLRKFQRIRILDPWCKRAMDGRVCIRVEDLNQVQIIGR